MRGEEIGIIVGEGESASRSPGRRRDQNDRAAPEIAREFERCLGENAERGLSTSRKTGWSRRN